MLDPLINNENDCIENLIDLVTIDPKTVDIEYSPGAQKLAAKLLNNILENPKIAEIATENDIIGKLSDFWEKIGEK